MLKSWRHVAVAACALTLGTGMALVTGVPAAEAATTRCRRAPAGPGGLDTFRVCTTVGVRTVQSTATLFTSAYRTGPRNVSMAVDLERNGVRITEIAACRFVGPLRPNSKVDCRTDLAGNVSGLQNYNSLGAVTVDGYLTSVSSPNSVG